MKILWITNTVFPELSKALGNKAPVLGGWMYGLANDLVKEGITLTIVTVKPNVKDHHFIIKGVEYYLFEGQKLTTFYDQSLIPKWKKLIVDVKPDLVHIHGTEYAHGLALLKSCPDEKYVISIQGLISVCARYYSASISLKEIKKYRTFRDFIRRDSIIQAKQKFKKRGDLIEKEYFKLSKNFIGRTSWDFDHTKILNKNATYHFCNESLRDLFYTSKKWDISKKQNHTIFLSQAGYPIKGLHQVVKALALLKSEFPKTKLRIAGDNILKSSTIRDKLALGGYGNYILHLIRKFKLENQIQFTGYLNENQMIKEYLNCNVFICPSSIENSPNSIGEAQLLGVPCISSYVGGTPDMIQHGTTGLLYRFEEIEMLAQSIKQVFTSSSLMLKLSKNSIQEANQRHNRETNAKNTLKIYKNILDQ